MTDDEAAIHEIMERRIEAMRTKDVAAFLSHYAAQTVRFELAPPLRQTAGRDDSRETLTAWLNSKGDLDYEIRHLVISAGTDIAFCHCITHLIEHESDSTVSNDMWYRTTLGLRKIEGQWRIEHEHNSTPFYMDGDARAAVDLKP